MRTFRPALLSAALAVLALAAPAGAVTTRTPTPGAGISAYYTILENLGDQRSDLAGGHARHRYKLPNPVYVIT
jgi:hypothetical protein